MEKKEKGFTLLEVVICIIIFVILLDGLWGIFVNINSEFIVFSKQVELDNDAQCIESFVKTYIRESDEVTVVVKDDTLAEIIIEADTNMMEQYERLTLVEIRLGKQTPTAAIDYSCIKYNSLGKELNYINNGTTSLIADKVRNIQITRKKESNLIEFTCELGSEDIVANVGDERKKIDSNFCESITYKQSSTNSYW